MLNKLSIGKKLALIALVPFLLFLAFAIPNILSNRSDAADAADTQQRATVSVLTGQVFESVRNEAVANQDAKGLQGFDGLDAAQDETDAAIEQWLAGVGDLTDADFQVYLADLQAYLADFNGHRLEIAGENGLDAQATDAQALRMIASFEGQLVAGAMTDAVSLRNAADLSTVSTAAAELQLLGLFSSYDGVAPAELPAAAGAAQAGADFYTSRSAAPLEPAAASYTSTVGELLATPAGGEVTIANGDWRDASNARAIQLSDARTALLAMASTDAVNAQNDSSGSVRNSALILLVSLIAAAGLAAVVAKSIKSSLAELSDEASQVANSDLPRLADALSNGVPVADIASDREPLELGDNEFGEVAASLTAVRESAKAVGERVSVLQGGIADTFVNLARRNQSLVDRQLEAIDTLEAEERDSDRLALMYRVDHLATRMRRNAESLLVLADAKTPERHSPAVELREVLRVAIGEVEDYRRIIPISLDDLYVAGPKAQDLAHLLAELMENAAQHSPPGTAVDVSGAFDASSGNYVATILDHGTGVEGAQMAQLNELLRRPPTSTLTISHSIGLQVVSRLAHSLNVQVELSHADDGGLSASVMIPAQVVADWAQSAPEGTNLSHTVAGLGNIAAPIPAEMPLPIPTPTVEPLPEAVPTEAEVAIPAAEVLPSLDIPDFSMASAPGGDLVDPPVEMPTAEVVPTIEMPGLDLPSFGTDIAEAPIVEAPIVEAPIAEAPIDIDLDPELPEVQEVTLPVPGFAETELPAPGVDLATPAYEAPAVEEPMVDPDFDVPVFDPNPTTSNDPFAEVSEGVPTEFYPEPLPEPFMPEPVMEAPAPLPEPIMPEPIMQAPAPLPEPALPEPVMPEPAMPEPLPEPVMSEPVMAAPLPQPIVREPIVQAPAPVAETAAPTTPGGLTKRTRSTTTTAPVDLEADRTAPSQRTPDQVKNMLSRYKTGLERGRGAAGTEGES